VNHRNSEIPFQQFYDANGLPSAPERRHALANSLKLLCLCCWQQSKPFAAHHRALGPAAVTALAGSFHPSVQGSDREPTRLAKAQKRVPPRTWRCNYPRASDKRLIFELRPFSIAMT
jgi:hypothetical protein